MHRRALLPAAAAAALALTLAGCSASGGSPDDIEVTGDWGSAPEATFEAPLEVTETAQQVLVEGDGEEVAEGDSVDALLTIYGGESGQLLSQSDYDAATAAPLTANDDALLPGLVDALIGNTIGSRVLTTISPADAFGEQGSEGVGIGANESLVAIVDLIEKVPTAADGEPQDPEDGFPTVELDDTGRPTVTIPDADAPDELQVAVLKRGDGPEVSEAAAPTIQYQGVNWRTGEVFDESWGARGPSPMDLASTIPGFRDAIQGQTVGSQIIAVIPPEEGYGEAGQPAAGIEGDDTLVFVIDILGSTE